MYPNNLYSPLNHDYSSLIWGNDPASPCFRKMVSANLEVLECSLPNKEKNKYIFFSLS